MPEKLAIVTIDAGSNMTGNDPLYPERVGTSCGKGVVADTLRDNGGLAYDSGRAYRTITVAAMSEGIQADSPRFPDELIKWTKAGRFGHCDTGLSLDTIELNEHVVHAEDVSKEVANYGAHPAVRRFTKDMKLAWLKSYAGEMGVGLVGLDGRAMREFVLDEVETNIKGAELVSSLCMVVEVTEAARRRMAQRKVFAYDDPMWIIHPKLNATVKELTERAKKDEARKDDPVLIPAEYYDYAVRGDRGLTLRPVDQENLDQLITDQEVVLMDTTGAGKEEVRSVALKHILRTLQVLEGFDEQAEDLETRLST